jgi:predicted nucleic acid-binding protein
MGTIKINEFQNKLLSAGSIGLDSMVFLYHFADHPLYAPLTERIFQLVEEKKISAVTSTITIAEIFVRAEQIQDQATIFAYEQVFASLPSLSLISIDTPLARLASKLRAKYPKIRLPDAIQLSAPLYKQCPLFVTNDKKLTISELDILYLDDWVTPHSHLH